MTLWRLGALFSLAVGLWLGQASGLAAQVPTNEEYSRLQEAFKLIDENPDAAKEAYIRLQQSVSGTKTVQRTARYAVMKIEIETALEKLEFDDAEEKTDAIGDLERAARVGKWFSDPSDLLENALAHELYALSVAARLLIGKKVARNVDEAMFLERAYELEPDLESFLTGDVTSNTDPEQPNPSTESKFRSATQKLNYRTSPDYFSDDADRNWAGYLEKGDEFEVIETVPSSTTNYDWYRIRVASEQRLVFVAARSDFSQPSDGSNFGRILNRKSAATPPKRVKPKTSSPEQTRTRTRT